MNLKIHSETLLEDGTSRILIEIPAAELLYVGFLLESFEGWCNYTTVKKDEPYLQVDVTKDYLEPMHELLEYMKNWKV